jgi:hypothetical protein
MRVSFEPGQAEKYFDFQFNSYSEEPIVITEVVPEEESIAISSTLDPVESPLTSIVSSSAPSVPEATPSGAEPSDPESPSSEEAVPLVVDEAPRQTLVLTTQGNVGSGPKEEPIPATLEGILTEFDAQSKQLASQIDDNVPLGLLWVPAIRTKNLALAALNDYLEDLPAEQQVIAEDAASRLLRAAYAIDNFGDLGDREAIVSVHEEFKKAAEDFGAAYAAMR